MNEFDEDLMHKLELEQEILRVHALNDGIPFELEQKSILKYLPGKRNEFGKRVRVFKFYKQYARTMDATSAIKLDMSVNTLTLQSGNVIRDKNNIIKHNAKLAAKVMAYALLNSSWKIKIFGGLATNYIYSRMDSFKFNELVKKLDEVENAKVFILSTASMAGQQRTTEPKTDKIEENPIASVRQ